MSDGFGQGPKKETVYGGPTPPAMDNQAFANPATPGTTGTVYSGPSTTQGTVYGGSTSTTAPKTAPTQTGISPRALNSANWFFWIAGLSLINSFISMGGGNWHFFAGLGITEVLDVLGGVGGSAGHAVALVINLLIAGVVCVFGYFARQSQKWAFLVGMILYAGDAVIFLLAGDIRSVLFHGLVLFFIFRGFSQL
jgi:hypothetical protein